MGGEIVRFRMKADGRGGKRHNPDPDGSRGKETPPRSRRFKGERDTPQLQTVEGGKRHNPDPDSGRGEEKPPSCRRSKGERDTIQIQTVNGGKRSPKAPKTPKTTKSTKTLKTSKTHKTSKTPTTAITTKTTKTSSPCGCGTGQDRADDSVALRAGPDRAADRLGAGLVGTS